MIRTVCDGESKNDTSTSHSMITLKDALNNSFRMIDCAFKISDCSFQSLHLAAGVNIFVISAFTFD